MKRQTNGRNALRSMGRRTALLSVVPVAATLLMGMAMGLPFAAPTGVVATGQEPVPQTGDTTLPPAPRITLGTGTSSGAPFMRPAPDTANPSAAPAPVTYERTRPLVARLTFDRILKDAALFGTAGGANPRSLVVKAIVDEDPAYPGSGTTVERVLPIPAAERGGRSLAVTVLTGKPAPATTGNKADSVPFADALRAVLDSLPARPAADGGGPSPIRVRLVAGNPDMLVRESRDPAAGVVFLVR